MSTLSNRSSGVVEPLVVKSLGTSGLFGRGRTRIYELLVTSELQSVSDDRSKNTIEFIKRYFARRIESFNKPSGEIVAPHPRRRGSRSGGATLSITSMSEATSTVSDEAAL